MFFIYLMYGYLIIIIYIYELYATSIKIQLYILHQTHQRFLFFIRNNECNICSLAI